MKKIVFNCCINNKNYNFYASWDNNYRVKSMFSSNIDGSYNGEINLFGKQANNFVYCLNKIDTSKITNKHTKNLDNCYLTINDDKTLVQNKWDLHSFPNNIDYLYTAIALCDSKFLNIFKKEAF